jgi:hypothetical protein
MREKAKVEARSRRMADGAMRRRIWWAAALVGVTAGALVTVSQGKAALARFGIGYAAGVACACLLVWLLAQRAAPETASLADLLTLARWMVGALLLGSLTMGQARGSEPMAWLAFGAALDIEADSWLTLWCAGAAVVWGGLLWVCLAPPLLRYAQPLLDLCAGRLPQGGGPWWSRVTGVAQMLLLIGVLAPVNGPERDTVIGFVVWPVSGAQLATMIALLLPRLRWQGARRGADGYRRTRRAPLWPGRLVRRNGTIQGGVIAAGRATKEGHTP